MVGLIPAAVGGASLEEWMPDYIWNGNNAEGGTLSPIYYPGCHNLFSCALRSAYLSLRSCGGGSIRGILWYQGCTDASMEGELPHTYSRRFQSFVTCMRSMIQAVQRFVADELRHEKLVNFSLSATAPDNEPFNLPDQHAEDDPPQLIPIVTVAVTSTRPWLSLDLIRRQQLLASQEIPSLDVVDAFGSLLAADCIHLTTLSLLRLGIRMASSMLRLLGHGLSYDYAKGIDGVVHPPTCALEVEESKLASIFQGCFKKLDNELDQRAQLLQPRQPAQDTYGGGGVFPVLSSGRKAVNFVSGDVSFHDMFILLRDYLRLDNLSGGEARARVFVDLGCGSGIALCAALASRRFSLVVGMDLKRTKVVECQELVRRFSDLLRQGASYSDVAASKVLFGDFLLPIEVSKGSYCQSEANSVGNDGSFEWSKDANVVYACCTCFADDVMAPLVKQCQGLRSGSFVILMDKTALDGNSDTFTLFGSCQCNTTWGDAKAYIYRKV